MNLHMENTGTMFKRNYWIYQTFIQKENRKKTFIKLVLTVISENVAADALIDNLALWEHLISLPLNPAGAVLCDQTGYGSLIQNVSWRPLCRTRRLWDQYFSILV